MKRPLDISATSFAFMIALAFYSPPLTTAASAQVDPVPANPADPALVNPGSADPVPVTADSMPVKSDPIEVRINKKIDEVFESTSTRYKREQKAIDEEQKVQEELRRQEEELRANQEILKRKNVPSRGKALGAESAKGVRVVIFTASNCPDCERLKEFLKGVQVPFVTYDVEKDKNAEDFYVRNVGRGILPVTQVNGKSVRGYVPDEIRKLIREAKEK